MSPRIRLKPALLLMAFFLMATVHARAEDQKPGRSPVIKFYQDHISPIDGNRCPMSPSCSAYAARAMEDHGRIMGWIMAWDRLMRCGRDETKLSHTQKIKGQTYTSDHVEVNDFWWFERTISPPSQTPEKNRENQ